VESCYQNISFQKKRSRNSRTLLLMLLLAAPMAASRNRNSPSRPPWMLWLFVMSPVTQRRVARALRAGGPDVIEVGVEELTPLKAGEVLVRVEAAGLNHAETLIRSGNYAVRLRPFSQRRLPCWCLFPTASASRIARV
jgi:hypothetical protein